MQLEVHVAGEGERHDLRPAGRSLRRGAVVPIVAGCRSAPEVPSGTEHAVVVVTARRARARRTSAARIMATRRRAPRGSSARVTARSQVPVGTGHTSNRSWSPCGSKITTLSSSSHWTSHAGLVFGIAAGSPDRQLVTGEPVAHLERLHPHRPHPAPEHVELVPGPLGDLVELEAAFGVADPERPSGAAGDLRQVVVGREGGLGSRGQVEPHLRHLVVGGGVGVAEEVDGVRRHRVRRHPAARVGCRPPTGGRRCGWRCRTPRPRAPPIR